MAEGTIRGLSVETGEKAHRFYRGPVIVGSAPGVAVTVDADEVGDRHVVLNLDAEGWSGRPTGSGEIYDQHGRTVDAFRVGPDPTVLALGSADGVRISLAEDRSTRRSSRPPKTAGTGFWSRLGNTFRPVWLLIAMAALGGALTYLGTVFVSAGAGGLSDDTGLPVIIITEYYGAPDNLRTAQLFWFFLSTLVTAVIASFLASGPRAFFRQLVDGPRAVARLTQVDGQRRFGVLLLSTGFTLLLAVWSPPWLSGILGFLIGTLVISKLGWFFADAITRGIAGVVGRPLPVGIVRGGVATALVGGAVAMLLGWWVEDMVPRLLIAVVLVAVGLVVVTRRRSRAVAALFIVGVAVVAGWASAFLDPAIAWADDGGFDECDVTSFWGIFTYFACTGEGVPELLAGATWSIGWGTAGGFAGFFLGNGPTGLRPGGDYNDATPTDESTVPIDSDGDGDVDVFENYRDGVLVSRDIDSDGDGTLEVTHHFDAEGTKTSADFYTKDGTLTRTELYVSDGWKGVNHFDPDGKVTHSEVFRGDGTKHVDMTYEPDGTVINQPYDENGQPRGYEVREHPDGSRELWTTDDQGRDVVQFDSDGEAPWERREVYEDGRLVYEESDTRGDGVADHSVMYGDDHTTTIDKDSEGRPTRIQWDEQGTQVTVDRVYGEPGGDEYSTQTETVGPDGTKTRWVDDRKVSVEHPPKDDGVVRVDRSTNADGKANVTEFKDAETGEVRERYVRLDTDGDQKFDRIEVYDGEDNLLDVVTDDSTTSEIGSQTSHAMGTDDSATPEIDSQDSHAMGTADSGGDPVDVLIDHRVEADPSTGSDAPSEVAHPNAIKLGMDSPGGAAPEPAVGGTDPSGSPGEPDARASAGVVEPRSLGTAGAEVRTNPEHAVPVDRIDRSIASETEPTPVEPSPAPGADDPWRNYAPPVPEPIAEVTPALAAGWYRNPQRLRWWEGRWTSHIHELDVLDVAQPAIPPTAGDPTIPGWYPDPAQLRYWDGRSWTAHLHNQ